LGAPSIAKVLPPIRKAAQRLEASPAQVLFAWLIRSGHQPLTGTRCGDDGGGIDKWGQVLVTRMRRMRRMMMMMPAFIMFYCHRD